MKVLATMVFAVASLFAMASESQAGVVRVRAGRAAVVVRQQRVAVVVNQRRAAVVVRQRGAVRVRVINSVPAVRIRVR